MDCSGFLPAVEKALHVFVCVESRCQLRNRGQELFLHGQIYIHEAGPFCSNQREPNGAELGRGIEAYSGLFILGAGSKGPKQGIAAEYHCVLVSYCDAPEDCQCVGRKHC